ncbi:MAG: type II toxin-antitoxin system RelE/ParE family toxin [Burkholderiaceae bacterium]|jgi:putative addiction module killer protein|nr:type II toxin-antitoxin system RelE/ParE family toxin [Burkholderiaceae bacterium]
MKYVVRQTETFAAWRSSLTDLKAAPAIRRWMARAAAGSLGDVRPVRGSVSEMRIGVGAGYRLYFTVRARTLLFLLVGGNKSAQKTDIRRALALAKELNHDD